MKKVKPMFGVVSKNGEVQGATYDSRLDAHKDVVYSDEWFLSRAPHRVAELVERDRKMERVAKLAVQLVNAQIRGRLGPYEEERQLMKAVDSWKPRKPRGA